jgi:hypothetical protein
MNNLNNIINLIKDKTNHTPQPSTKPSECMVDIIYNKIQKMSLRYQRLPNLPNIAHPLSPYSSANVMLGYSRIEPKLIGSSFIL